MPYKFSHPCFVKNCFRLARPGEQFCEEHRKQFDRDYNKKQRLEGKSRDYWSSSEWRKIRKIQLKKHPVCVICGERAEEVDHIISVRRGGNNSPDNLQSLCKTCHSRKTAKEGRWGLSRFVMRGRGD